MAGHTVLRTTLPRYGGKVKASEHGPLWWREPGYRAPDTQLRYERSVEMTTRELEKYLPIWCDKCCEELKLMEREARIESLQEALRHEVFFVL